MIRPLLDEQKTQLDVTFFYFRTSFITLLLKVHLLSLAGNSPTQSIKHNPGYRQSAIKMSNAGRNTTGTGAVHGSSTAFGTRSTMAFAPVSGCCHPSTIKRQFRWTTCKCFILVIRLHTKTQPLSQQPLSRIPSLDTYLNIRQQNKTPYKIWGFHGGDYEECCLLGDKTPVRTSQETHYVSATEPSQLMLCHIWGFHGGNYEECRLLGCYAARLL
jgi:hypothetical protein